jgi:hypothetical protein
VDSAHDDQAWRREQDVDEDLGVAEGDAPGRPSRERRPGRGERRVVDRSRRRPVVEDRELRPDPPRGRGSASRWQRSVRRAARCAAVRTRPQRAARRTPRWTRRRPGRRSRPYRSTRRTGAGGPFRSPAPRRRPRPRRFRRSRR